jgi:hypothetical protein
VSDQRVADMQFLMEQPAFRRFVFRSIQTAGMLTHKGAGTQGFDGRDLAFAEGCRSLGFFILAECECGLPSDLQRPADNLMTLLSVLNEESKDIGTEKKNVRRNDRYGDDDGDDGSRG